MTTRSSATKKLGLLEGQLEILKRFFVGKPNAQIDEDNWQSIKKDVKRTRKEIYRQRYGKN